jgi:fibronectin type 3 domain-containing protein
MAEYSWSFTTGSSTDTGPPSVPTGLTATAEESSLIALSWDPSTDDTEVAGYEIRRNFVDIIASVNSVAYSDDGLQPNTTYDYEVRAFDLAGNKSGWSSPSAQATTPPDTPPDNVTNFQTSPGDGQVTFSWDNPTDFDFEGVWLLRKEGGYPSDPEDKLAIPVYNGKDRSAVDPPDSDPPLPPLENGTTYYYRIYTYDTAGNFSSGVQKTATPKTEDTTPPAEVTNFQAIPGNQQVKLSWTNPRDPDFDIVILSRDGKNIYKEAGTSYLDTLLINGKTYTYVIKTVDTSGNISKGVSKTAKPEKPASTTTNTYNPTHDSFIYAGAPGTNYGKDTILRSGVKGLKSNYFIYTLINFEGINAIVGEKVVRATLKLYYESQSGAVGDEYFHVHMLYPIKWDEGSVTWKYMEGFGSFFDARKIFAETKVLDGKPGYVSWDVTELVYLWLSDPKTYPNAGLLVKATPKMILDHYFDFHSKENKSLPPNPPILEVEFVN